MKVQLNYGYRDMEDVVHENERLLKITHNVETELSTDEYGQIHVLLISPWRFEIYKYVVKFLGDPTMADAVIDYNIVQ